MAADPARNNKWHTYAILEPDADERLLAGLAVDAWDPATRWRRHDWTLSPGQYLGRYSRAQHGQILGPPPPGRPVPLPPPDLRPAAILRIVPAPAPRQRPPYGSPEEWEETYCQSIACLAEALIDMRPYIHPSHYRGIR